MSNDWFVHRYKEGNFLDEPAISALDPGFLYGDGLFETLRAEDGVVLFAEEHFERLQRSCLSLQIKADLDGLSKTALEQLLHDSENVGGIARVKVIVTRGVDEPTVVVMLRRESAGDFEPVPCRVYPEPRECPMARHKSLSYSYYWSARRWAQANESQYAILIDLSSRILEADMANVFVVQADRITRPPKEMPRLVGIIERMLCDRIFPRLGLICEEQFLKPDEITEDCSMFLTNSMVDALPVSSFNGIALKDCVALAAQIREYLREEHFRSSYSMLPKTI